VAGKIDVTGGREPDEPPRTHEIRASGNVIALIGDYGRQVVRLVIKVPKLVWALVVILMTAVLVVGAGWLYFDWFAPAFAPNYRTQFLIDSSAATEPGGLAAVTASLRTTVENSGDKDALSLRSFGGECGTPGNTARLVDFGVGNQNKIYAAAARMRPGTRPTLVRGIVQAVEDFSQPLAQKARQVNRIIVVTRHGTDACDSDLAYVEKEIQERVRAAGLSLEFRIVGYQVPKAQRQTLDQISTAAKAPAPRYVQNAAELNNALNWFANVEPVLRGAGQMVGILNPTVKQVNDAAAATVDGRLDVAGNTLDRAKKSLGASDAQFRDLRDRAKGARFQDVYARARRLREQQRQVVAAATALLKAAQEKRPLDPLLGALKQAADTYNAEVNAMNRVLRELRAELTRKP
jgi:hypothetical protein